MWPSQTCSNYFNSITRPNSLASHPTHMGMHPLYPVQLSQTCSNFFTRRSGQLASDSGKHYFSVFRSTELHIFLRRSLFLTVCIFQTIFRCDDGWLVTIIRCRSVRGSETHVIHTNVMRWKFIVTNERQRQGVPACAFLPLANEVGGM